MVHNSIELRENPKIMVIKVVITLYMSFYLIHSPLFPVAFFFAWRYMCISL